METDPHQQGRPMATRSKKQQRKQKKQLERKRLKAKRRARPNQTLTEASSGQSKSAPAVLAKRQPSEPKRPEREPTPFDLWWEAYTAADGNERLRMTREKLATVQPDDEWYDVVFPEAVDELQTKLSDQEFVAFLEEIEQSRPDVFAISAQWNVWSMAFLYIAEERFEDLNRAVCRLADELREFDAPLFSLISLLRLAGRTEPAQRLIDVATARLGGSGLMYWAVDELIEWALFDRYQTCAQAGATDEAIDAVYQYSLTIGVTDSQRSRDNQRDFAVHLAGEADKTWTREELREGGEAGARKVYLLFVDFLRWLCTSRGLVPMVADELRRILIRLVNDMDCKPDALLRGLRRPDFEPVLARRLSFMSLDRAHAPAGVIAMLYFYDFLAEFRLVDEPTRESAKSLCRLLWKEIKRAMKDDWRKYQFLERYLPEAEDLKG